ncbi:MAG: dihydropteroate synthase [Verrucomicrobiota bacterium]
MLDLPSLARLAERHAEDLDCQVAAFDLGGYRFDGNARPELMGVINLSSGSWYRESVVPDGPAAVKRGRVLAAQGAAILDVGAESSLAHTERVGAGEQESLLLPVVRELAGEGSIVSVETYHLSVAAAVLEAGAKVLNLTGSVQTEAIYREAAAHEAGVIICYVAGPNVREVGDLELGRDPIAALYDYFAEQVDLATAAGVERLWIDPGLGFYYRNLEDSAERVRHQTRVFLESFRLRRLGWPVCQALPHAFATFQDEVRSAEAFFAVAARLGRVDLLRTHEVPRVRAVLDTLAQIRAE